MSEIMNFIKANSSIIGLVLSILILIQGFFVTRKIRNVYDARGDVAKFNKNRKNRKTNLEALQLNLNSDDYNIKQLKTDIRNEIAVLRKLKSVLSLRERISIIMINIMLRLTLNEGIKGEINGEISRLIASCEHEKRVKYGK